MAYHGARAAGRSTSPLSIAVPGGKREPVVFAMGTDVVSGEDWLRRGGTVSGIARTGVMPHEVSA